MTQSALNVLRAPSANRTGQSGAVTDEIELPTSPHRFFGRAVTAELRKELTDEALKILVPRLSPSMSRLDPVKRYTKVIDNWLDWLDGFAGRSYQDRWLASGADDLGRTWHRSVASTHQTRAHTLRAFEAVVCAGAIRPSYAFLVTVVSRRLWSTWREEHDRVLFARVTAAGHDCAIPQRVVAATLIDLARISIRTGKALAQFSCADLLDYQNAVIATKGTGILSYATTYFLARQAGLFADGPDEFEALRTKAPRSPAEIVVHFGVVSPKMRELLTEYLAERRPSMDYNSFEHLAQRLCRLFWRDIEIANPGIDTHRLTRAQADAWKERITTLPNGKPRQRFTEVLIAVRSFYLDINHWANDYPERWAQWATPSPITRQDTRAISRQRKSEIARMHSRVRELVPLLPTLVSTVRAERGFSSEALRIGRAAEPGERFNVGGVTLTRVATRRPEGLRLQREDGSIIDAVFAEHAAFWSWATVEVLRHTGIRIEELLELTHYSIRPYRQPNGSVVPLLQIAPSKTDAERVIPASPELASVLAQIITRVASRDGTISLTTRYDQHERTWSEPLPYLFQYRRAGRPRTFSGATLREFLRRSLARAGMSLEPGVRLSPHDFRRIFTTEAVNNGLPVHIAAALLGHQDLNTTMAYTAIYPQEVFARYQQFIQRRRDARPVEDYRAPTAGELAEFADHFGKRRIELGACVRPYGTPCIHEHACLRCPFQQIEPDHLPRLIQIRSDIIGRIKAARDNEWLGDVAQLEQTLRHVDDKHAQLLRLLADPHPLVTAATSLHEL